MGFTDMRFNVNLSILFTELPLLERPAAARAAGFTAVELWWPWVDAPTPEQSELDALREAIEDAGVHLVGLNFYAGQLPGPDRGALSVPGAESEKFRANVPVAIAFATSLGCTTFNALYGNRIEGTDPAVQDALALENLTFAARAVGEVGGTLLIEALNAPESPACPIVSAPKAIEVIDAVNAATGLDNTRFLMDLYHLSMNGEDLDEVIDHHTDKTAHVQIADNPGRGAPGTGTLDFTALLGRLKKNGYDGYIGLEYKPGTTPSTSAFAWLPAPLRPAH
ncbi:TIM barrel protein [Streptomyces sp. YGL11-2]|uniref:TIM barrel protein n=1 Tax=Streptomyces sp. YGL11-2 TaxID=3414028 RepID=UPI003CE986E6